MTLAGIHFTQGGALVVFILMAIALTVGVYFIGEGHDA